MSRNILYTKRSHVESGLMSQAQPHEVLNADAFDCLTTALRQALTEGSPLALSGEPAVGAHFITGQTTGDGYPSIGFREEH